jgi:hypothetical protein
MCLNWQEVLQTLHRCDTQHSCLRKGAVAICTWHVVNIGVQLNVLYVADASFSSE